MAARTKRINMHETAKAKIQSSQLVNALMKHALGKNKMGATQITAAIALLRKTVPDLSAVQVEGEIKSEQPWIGPKPLTESDWQDKHGEGTKH